jgi:hypothetical protein
VRRPRATAICFSLSDSSDDLHPSRAAHQEASRVFWFCLGQLQLDGDVLSASFHPDWQQEQHAWPKFVQQVQRCRRERKWDVDFVSNGRRRTGASPVLATLLCMSIVYIPPLC